MRGSISRFAFVFLVLAFGASMCWSQAADSHVTDNPAQVVYILSPFAHGYAHGYEQGFHLADEDFQTGSFGHDPRRMEDFHRPIGYASKFGDRGEFERGYHAGFLSGYNDGIRGRSFREIGEMERIATGLTAKKNIPDSAFDLGLRVGYTSARQHGAGAMIEVDQVSCGVSKSSWKHADYCNGFRRGFQLGAADAELMPSPTGGEQTASQGEGGSEP